MYESRFLSAIETLLYQHNTVILPNFGGFEAYYQPAKIDFLSATISPPARLIIFNSQLISNDNLLINYIATQNNWTVENTEQALAAWVEQLKQTLTAAKTLPLPNLGRIYLDTNNSTAFEQSGTNFLSNSFGLPTIEKLQIFAKKIAEKIEDAPKNYRPLIARTEAPAAAAAPTKNNNKIAAFLAISLLSIGLPFLIWQFWPRTTVSNNNNQTAFTFPAYFDFNNNSQPILTDSTLADTTLANNQTPEPTIEPTQQNNQNTNTYIVVIGAFTENRNANRLLRQLEKEGYFPDVATTNSGLQRIGIQITCAPAELKLHLSDIRRKFTPEAWLLKS
jgi:cell division septation protein DedD/nucleoid DNA-binding protein